MTDSYRNAAAKFLAQKENFRFARDIYELFPEARDQLITGFWDELEKAIRAKLMTRDEFHHYELRCDDEKQIGKERFGISLVPDSGRPRWCFRLEVENAGYYVGICTVEDRPMTAREGEYVRNLKEDQRLKGYKFRDQEDYWLAWKHVAGEIQGGTEQALMIAESGDELLARIIDSMKREWPLCERHLEQLNKTGKSPR